jgi:hypothetical protein
MRLKKENLNPKCWLDKIASKAESYMNNITEYGVQNRIEPSIKAKLNRAGNIVKLLGITAVTFGYPVYHLEKTKNSYEGPARILSHLLDKGFSKDEIEKATF